MLNFGIDLDGVCFDWQDFVNWHNKLYGTSFTKKDFLSPGFCDNFDISYGVLERRVDKMYKTVGVRNLIPAKGAVSGVREISKIGRTLAITSRPPWAYEDTHFWIKAHFNRAFSGGINFTKNRHIQNNEHVQTKLDVCIREGVSYLLEDDLHYATPCAESGVKVLLFDYYGKGTMHENVHNVYSWPEAVAKIKEIEGIVKS